MHDMPSLIYPPYLTENSDSKLPSHFFKKENKVLGSLPNNFAKLPLKLSNLY